MPGGSMHEPPRVWWERASLQTQIVCVYMRFLFPRWQAQQQCGRVGQGPGFESRVPHYLGSWISPSRCPSKFCLSPPSHHFKTRGELLPPHLRWCFTNPTWHKPTSDKHTIPPPLGQVHHGQEGTRNSILDQDLWHGQPGGQLPDWPLGGGQKKPK